MSDRPDQPDGDDDSLDWLNNIESDDDSSGEEASGFTDELDWSAVTSDDESDAESTDDDLSFDWVTDASDDAPRTERTGLTGQLSWQADVHDEAADAASTDEGLAFEWAPSDTDDEEPQGASTGLTDELDWQDDMEDRLEQQLGEPEAPEDTLDAESASGGLLGQLGADEPAAGDVPSWLADMGDAEADDEGGADMPDWLAVDLGSGDDDAEDDAYTTDADFEEAEVTPDWLMDMGFGDEDEATDGDEVAEPAAADDWLMDLEDEPPPEEEDFYLEDEPMSEEPPFDEPDWLAGGFDDEDIATEEVTAAADVPAEMPDWLMGGFDDDEEDELVGEAEIDQAEMEEDAAPDWLMGGFDDDEEDEFVPAAAMDEADDGSMDWLADMGFDEPDDEDESEFEAIGFDGTEDFSFDAGMEASPETLFMELDDEDDEAIDDDLAAFTGASADADDFGFDFGDDEDEDEATRIDTDYLRAMGIGTPGDEGTVDELDWFSEPEASDSSEELDWLEQLGDIEDLDSLLTDEDAAPAAPVEETPEPADPLAELDALLETFAVQDTGDDDDLSDLLGELEQLDDVDLSDLAGEDEQLASIGMTGMLGEYDPAEERDEEQPANRPGVLTGMLEDWNLQDDFEAVAPDSPEDIAAILDQLDAEDEDDDFDIDAFDPDMIELEDDDAEEPAAEPNADFQALLDAYGVEGDEPLPEDAPDWLRELRESRETNQDMLASSLIRERGDKSLDDLPDRLLDLRERGLNISVSREQDEASVERIARVVPNVKETLLPAEIATESSELAGSVKLTPEQQERAELLRAVVGATAALPTVTPLPPTEMHDLDALDIDEEGELDADALLAEEPEAEAASAVTPRRRTRRKLQPDRVLLSLLILGLIVLPFFLPPARIGTLPPSQLPANSPAMSVFEQVEGIAPGDLVLVAVEYGLAATGELDGATDALLRHIVLKGGRPLVVSTNPVGLLHSAEIMEAIAANGLQANRDYYILQFLPAGAVGLRDLTLNLVSLANMDYQNQATGLNLTSFDDFSLIVVIAEQAESIRAWSEQVGTQTTAPIVAAISYAASPLSQPYIATGGVDGLMVGYQDAFSYASMLKAGAPEIVPETAPEVTPEANTTTPPTLTPPPPTATTPAEESTADNEAGASTGVESTQEPADSPTQPPTFTPTEEPTQVPTQPPTATVETPQPTPTTEPTQPPTPTPTQIPTIEVAVVISGGAVNLRGGPGTNFPVVATASDGESFPVLGFNDDESWVQIELTDGREAWIATFLVEIREETLQPEQSSLKQLDVLHRWKGAAPSRLRPFLQAENTPEPADSGLLGVFNALRQDLEQPDEPVDAAAPEPEITPEAVPEATPEVYTPPQIDAGAIAAATQADDPLRWYAMTLGTLGAIVVISLGTVVNLIRHLLRREED